MFLDFPEMKENRAAKEGRKGCQVLMQGLHFCVDVILMTVVKSKSKYQPRQPTATLIKLK
jgi:hypothetical protein